MANISVLYVTSELHPLIKTGGLGDVAGALPQALRALGVDVRILVPGYRAVMDSLALRPIKGEHSLLPGVPRAMLLEGCMPDGETPVFVLDTPALYQRDGGPYQAADGHDWSDNAVRFAMLSRMAALMSSASSPIQWRPDVLHLNDWQSGIAAAYLAFTRDRTARVVQSIHNLAYLGAFPDDLITALALPREGFNMHGYELHGWVSFLKAGIFYADAVTTVSPRYAQEIRTPGFGGSLHGLLADLGPRLSGILNGIDDTVWDPATDPLLPAHYSAASLAGKASCKAALQSELGLPVEPDVPVLAVVSRLTHQKGIDLIAPALHRLAQRPFQLVILGTGESRIVTDLTDLARAAPSRVCFNNRFDEGLAHRIEAGADIFLMPSRFEPCGLNQMYSMRYGTPPVVHRTGGLADTVVHASDAALADGTATGFVFEFADATGLSWAVGQALERYQDPATWQALQRGAMNRDFGWHSSAAAYQSLYAHLLAGSD